MSNVSFVQYVTCKCLDDDALCRISRLVTIKVPYNTNGFFFLMEVHLEAKLTHAITHESITVYFLFFNESLFSLYSNCLYVVNYNVSILVVQIDQQCVLVLALERNQKCKE